MKLCVSAFCNIFCNIYGKIYGIPENVPRFLKNVFHIPEGQHLGLGQKKKKKMCLLFDENLKQGREVDFLSFFFFFFFFFF